MNTLSGTFMAKVREGAIEFPFPIRRFCELNEWSLFRVLLLDDDRLEIQPVLPGEESDLGASLDKLERNYHSSLSGEGKLWIPLPLRELASLGEQSVMMRIEEGVIRIYLRKVFRTLGFGP